MFTFYGRKKRLGPLYPKPICTKIIEPFAGSAAYSVLYYANDIELYDIDANVCSAWNFLIRANRNDVLSLPMLEAGDRLDKFTTLSWEERCFLGYMIQASPATIKTTATTRSNWNDRMRKYIANNVWRVDHFKIQNTSYDTISNERATWFIDPPYQNGGQYYKCRLTKQDYIKLALYCKSRRGQVIVCEADGADWLDFEYLTPSLGQAGPSRPSHKRTELIWTKSCM